MESVVGPTSILFRDCPDKGTLNRFVIVPGGPFPVPWLLSRTGVFISRTGRGVDFPYRPKIFGSKSFSDNKFVGSNIFRPKSFRSRKCLAENKKSAENNFGRSFFDRKIFRSIFFGQGISLLFEHERSLISRVRTREIPLARTRRISLIRTREISLARTRMISLDQKMC